MKLSEEILTMLFAFSDEGRKQGVRDIAKRVKALEDFAEDIRDNYDCDADAHKYKTTCRRCTAEKVLKDEKDNSKN